MAVTEAMRMARMLAQDTTARQKQIHTAMLVTMALRRKNPLKKAHMMITEGIRIKGLTLEHTLRCTLPDIRIE